MKYIKCRSEFPSVRADILRLLCLISDPKHNDIQVIITKKQQRQQILTHQELVP